MTSEEMKKEGRRNRFVGRILMTCMSIVIVFIFSMPVGAVTQSPPYAIGAAGHTDAGTPGYGYVDHYVYPWARSSDGHFGSETAPNFRSVGQSGVYRSCSAVMYFNGPNFNPSSGTKSYLIVATWNFNWHERMKMYGGFGTPCSGYARCDIDVRMNVYSVTHSQWLGSDFVIHVADYTRYSANSEISYDGSMGSTGTYWNLENGHQYYCWAEVTTYGYLYSGSYPTYVSEAWARCDIWRSGDATLVSFAIT